MKALELLKTNQALEERALAFSKSIKRDIQNEVLDPLVKQKEKIEDELFELKNFTLNTDLNQGIIQMSKDQCKERFKKIINLEYNLKLVSVELAEKQKSFDTYFGEETATTDEK